MLLQRLRCRRERDDRSPVKSGCAAAGSRSVEELVPVAGDRTRSDPEPSHASNAADLPPY
jgi:hypothetical protein